MKKYCLLFVIAFSATKLMAQTNFIVHAGGIYSGAKIVEDDVKQHINWGGGFTAGLLVKVPFEKALHFSPSLNFVHKKYGYNHISGPVATTTYTLNAMDLSMPLTMDFKTSGTSRFIAGLGPILSVEISGKEKSLYTNNTITTTKMIFDFSNYSIIDVGLAASLGYNFNNKILVQAVYNYGMANTENDETIKRNIQARTLSFTVGYFLK